MGAILSPDMQAQWPRINLRTKILRAHKETITHPIFKWIKKEVDVIDQLEFLSIDFTQMGTTTSIPLSPTHEEEDAN